MRQRCSERVANRMRRETGLPVFSVWVRGGTGHRFDLYLYGGDVWYYWRASGDKPAECIPAGVRWSGHPASLPGAEVVV